MSIQPFNDSTVENNNQNERTEPTLTIADVVGIKLTAKKRQTCCGWV